jgi:anti-sigma regulatory factor (Ser/Thr protein kinase)
MTEMESKSETEAVVRACVERARAQLDSKGKKATETELVIQELVTNPVLLDFVEKHTYVSSKKPADLRIMEDA